MKEYNARIKVEQRMSGWYCEYQPSIGGPLKAGPFTTEGEAENTVWDLMIAEEEKNED